MWSIHLPQMLCLFTQANSDFWKFESNLKTHHGPLWVVWGSVVKRSPTLMKWFKSACCHYGKKSSLQMLLCKNVDALNMTFTFLERAPHCDKWEYIFCKEIAAPISVKSGPIFPFNTSKERKKARIFCFALGALHMYLILKMTAQFKYFIFIFLFF